MEETVRIENAAALKVAPPALCAGETLTGGTTESLALGGEKRVAASDTILDTHGYAAAYATNRKT